MGRLFYVYKKFSFTSQKIWYNIPRQNSRGVRPVKKRISNLNYRIIRWLIWLFYPRVTVFGTKNLPHEPCVIVANHAQLHGPIACQLYFPGDRAIWCASEMMELRKVANYAYTDFWSQKPAYIKWFYRLLSYLITPLSVCVFNNASTIGVFRGNKIIQTFRQTQKHLVKGTNVVIFPEENIPHNQIVYEFQRGFVDVARQYYKQTGKELAFVPMYIAPKLRGMYIGKPVFFCADQPTQEERKRICTYLMDEITGLAQSLPRHTVVPYPNIPKKAYPVNVPCEECKT